MAIAASQFGAAAAQTVASSVNASSANPLANNSAGNSANNPIAAENRRSGTADWKLTNPALNHEIEGYASRTSIDRGEQIALYVKTSDPDYTIELFRMGWYGGKGARRMGSPIVRPSVPQPPPHLDSATGLIECSWQDPFQLTIDDSPDSDWSSGVYLAKLTASHSQKQSYIIFVVREDDRPSDYLFQSSVTTFQAYNNWGGRSLYRWNSRDGQAFKVSFNRPYAPSPNPAAGYGVGAGEFLTNVQPPRRVSSAGWEYSMVRWLEREGYDVTYATDIDTHANPRLLQFHRVFLSVGHDEYWSWEMRQNVEAARDGGVSLGFFSSNTCYWQIRLEPGTQGSNRFVPDRTIVAYKEWSSLDPVIRDRISTNDKRLTTQWRDRRVNRPEAELIGVMYDADPVMGDITIAETAPDWILDNTKLKPGSRLVGLLGYEVDRITPASPDNVEAIAHSPYRWHRQTRFSDMATYETDRSAVFATGSMQWSWGLDDFNAPVLRSSYRSNDAQQMTRNVLAYLKQQAKNSQPSS